MYIKSDIAIPLLHTCSRKAPMHKETHSKMFTETFFLNSEKLETKVYINRIRLTKLRFIDTTEYYTATKKNCCLYIMYAALFIFCIYLHNISVIYLYNDKIQNHICWCEKFSKTLWSGGKKQAIK